MVKLAISLLAFIALRHLLTQGFLTFAVPKVHKYLLFIMTAEDVKQEISELAKKHEAIDEQTISDFNDAEYIELMAEELIIAYCEHNGYMINGFPTDKRQQLSEEEQEEYFCRERFHLYLDRLAIEKEDIAEFWWFYHNCFWPQCVETKEKFLEQIKEQLESGFHDIEL